jgi:hypothetical protein
VSTSDDFNVGQPLKKTVRHNVHCNDSLIQIAGRSFLGVPTRRCEIQVSEIVTLIEGPISVVDHNGITTEVVKVRHSDEELGVHEGWIPASSLDSNSTEA